MTVYKYLHPGNTKVLEEGLIRFSQTAVLNDPFETTPNMQRLKKSFTERALRAIDEAIYSSQVEHVAARFKARAW